MSHDLIDEVTALSDEQHELMQELRDPRFQRNKRVRLGKAVLGWSQRNVAAARSTLTTVPDLDRITPAELEAVRDDLSFHLVNYSTSLAALRDYLFSWAREQPVEYKDIDSAALRFKKRPSVLIVAVLRNRLNHGAMVVDGLRIVRRFEVHKEGAGFDLFPTLTEETLVALAKVDSDVGSQIRESSNCGRDWLSPLLESAQAEAERAWDEAVNAYRAVYGADLDRHDYLLKRIPELQGLITAALQQRRK